LRKGMESKVENRWRTTATLVVAEHENSNEVGTRMAGFEPAAFGFGGLCWNPSDSGGTAGRPREVLFGNDGSAVT
ncbi:MAG: hypothetical protein AAF851_20045, partial [Myxococcota bacterium]